MIYFREKKKITRNNIWDLIPKIIFSKNTKNQFIGILHIAYLIVLIFIKEMQQQSQEVVLECSENMTHSTTTEIVEEDVLVRVQMERYWRHFSELALKLTIEISMERLDFAENTMAELSLWVAHISSEYRNGMEEDNIREMWEEIDILKMKMEEARMRTGLTKRDNPDVEDEEESPKRLKLSPSLEREEPLVAPEPPPIERAKSLRLSPVAGVSPSTIQQTKMPLLSLSLEAFQSMGYTEKRWGLVGQNIIKATWCFVPTSACLHSGRYWQELIGSPLEDPLSRIELTAVRTGRSLNGESVQLTWGLRAECVWSKTGTPPDKRQWKESIQRLTQESTYAITAIFAESLSSM